MRIVQLTFCVLITECAFAHIRELDGPLGASIHEDIAALRVELSSRDHLGQFLHVSGFDIYDVEALILDVEVPKVNAEVVAADECFAIAVGGYAVDMIGVRIGVYFPRYGSNHCVVMCHAREFKVRDASECCVGVPDRPTAICIADTSRGQFLG